MPIDSSAAMHRPTSAAKLRCRQRVAWQISIAAASSRQRSRSHRRPAHHQGFPRQAGPEPPQTLRPAEPEADFFMTRLACSNLCCRQARALRSVCVAEEKEWDPTSGPPPMRNRLPHLRRGIDVVQRIRAAAERGRFRRLCAKLVHSRIFLKNDLRSRN
jgi:hypothetical protein